jgi:periplasmic protein TonB
MQNNHGTLDAQDQPKISQTDKLLFCIFLALAFHGMLFFGIGFKVPDLNSASYEKTFNVVLAQFEAASKPKEANFIGQANQEGGGESDDVLTPSAREKALFNDPNQISSEPQQAQSEQQQARGLSEVLTGNGQTSASFIPADAASEKESLPDTASLVDRSYQISGLIANLDDQNINQAKKGRKRQVSASIHRSSDALYLDSWRRKIERIGNLNYPEKAKLDKIYGNVTIKVAINRDGTINNVTIMESSGNKILDRAALSIVRMAAPFGALTEEMIKDTDILEIIRVWQFQPDYRLKTK